MYNSIRSDLYSNSMHFMLVSCVPLAEICQASAQLYDDYLGSSTTSENRY